MQHAVLGLNIGCNALKTYMSRKLSWQLAHEAVKHTGFAKQLLQAGMGPSPPHCIPSAITYHKPVCEPVAVNKQVTSHTQLLPYWLPPGVLDCFPQITRMAPKEKQLQLGCSKRHAVLMCCKGDAVLWCCGNRCCRRLSRIGCHLVF
jgi:hypothetical protein